jgi:hypothetical protein
MPIQVELIKDNRVVLQTYTDPLDNTDLVALRLKMDRDIFPATEGKLHIIADFRAVKNLPTTTLTSGSAMLRKAHSNTGHIICVTENTFVTIIANVFANLAPKYQVKVVRSLEEAYREIDALLAKPS